MTIEALRERILRGDYPDGEPLVKMRLPMSWA
jgi:hypothetical protein